MGVRVRYPEGGGYSTQSWVSTVKLIEKAVVVNLHTEGAVTFGSGVQDKVVAMTSFE